MKTEVAIQLRVTERTLDRLIKAGEFPEALGNGMWTAEDVAWYTYRLTRFGKGKVMDAGAESAELPPEEDKK